jgi:hypothetical protein
LICLRDGFGLNQEVVNLPIDEVAVALEVLLVDIEPGRDQEESLELCHAHEMASGALARLHRGDHGTMLPRVGRNPIDGCQILPIFFSRFFQ